VVSGASKNSVNYSDLRERVTSLESARQADADRIQAQLDAERAKFVEIQESQQVLANQLAAAKELDINRRAELNIASDEIANLKKKHAREMTDLEIELDKKNRMLREANEELRECRSDLDRERETVSTLRATVTHQANAQLTITAENTALKAQVSALQSQVESGSCQNSDLTLKVGNMQKELEALRWEAMESEAIRRKLHNMVQELKGNIRVFCRVRPVLPSDLPEPSGSDTSEDLDKLQEELQANMTFPDRRDHKEIVLRSSSESATGQERIENYNFSFDRVSCITVVMNTSDRLARSLNPNRLKPKSLRRFPCSHRVVLTDTTSASLPTARLALASLLLWKVV